MSNNQNSFPELIFQTLISTVDGVGASTGKQTEEAFNENFSLVKTYLEALVAIAQVTVTSEQLTQFKVDTTTTPYTVYYSLDPIETENPTWTQLVNLSFANITGDPEDNIALKTILDSKGAASDVSTLQTQMSAAQSNISNLQNLTSQQTTAIGTNTSSINSIRSELLDTVHTTHGDTLYIRYTQATNTIEYSTDGTQWFNILSLGVTWDSISGLPSDSTSLVSYVTSEIQGAIASLTLDFVSTQDFTSHTSDINNPHSVTKAQIGLGNVQNYSPADMPLSTEAQQLFTDLATRFPEFAEVSSSAYLSDTPSTYVYLISDQANPNS